MAGSRPGQPARLLEPRRGLHEVRCLWIVGPRSAGILELPDLDQLEAERLDPVEQTVERSLILEDSAQHGFGGPERCVEVPKRRERRLADSALDADLVTGRRHTWAVFSGRG